MCSDEERYRYRDYPERGGRGGGGGGGFRGGGGGGFSRGGRGGRLERDSVAVPEVSREIEWAKAAALTRGERVLAEDAYDSGCGRV